MAFTKVSAALLVCAVLYALSAQGEACPDLRNTYAVSRKVKLTPVNNGFLSIRDITVADCERNCNANCDCKSWSFARKVDLRNNFFRVCTLYKPRVTVFRTVNFNTTVGIRNAAPPPKCPVVKPAGPCTVNSTFAFRVTKTGCGVSDISTITYRGVAKEAAGAVIVLGPLPSTANFISQTCQVNNNNCNVCEGRAERTLVVTVSKAKVVTVTVKVKGPRTCINVPGRVLTTCPASNLNA